MTPSSNGTVRTRDRASGWLAYGLALVLGLVLAWAVFPAKFIWPTSLGLPPGDMGQHAIGQRYFLAEPWGWPLLRAGGIIAPYGVNIAFLDSIPLQALVLKAVSAWLPNGFHGIGLWYALAWMLQPVAAVFCIRGTGERRILPVLAFAVLACSMPAWWGRFGHAALTGHFLLLLALGAYLRLCREVQAGTAVSWRGWLGAGVLLVAALLVHPYLMAMVAAILGAVPATLLARRMLGMGGRGWVRAVFGLAAGVAAIGGLAVLLRYGGAGPAGSTYGLYAMNLLSPIWPAGSGLLSASWRPEMVDAVGNGWEGYNWLGFGVLAALAVGLMAGPAAAGRTLARHAGLAAALLVLFLFSLSFQVGAGERIVLDLGAPPRVFETFRSSGRFFWPVAYALALFAVMLLARLSMPILRNGLLLAVCVLQWMDAGPLRHSVMAQAASPQYPESVELSALRQRLEGVSQVVLLPRWLCARYWPGGEMQRQDLLARLVGVASERAVPVNDMYLARWPRPVDCDVDVRTAATPLRRGELRVLLQPELLVPLVPNGDALCERAGTVALCRGSDGGWLAGRQHYGMQAGRPELAMLREGWSVPDDWATWTVENEASLALPETPTGSSRLRLGITVRSFAPKAGGIQGVTVLADGQPVARWQLPDWQDVYQTLDLPAGTTLLNFIIRKPTAPRKRGVGSDPRRLGMALIGLEVLP